MERDGGRRGRGVLEGHVELLKLYWNNEDWFIHLGDLVSFARVDLNGGI